MSALAKGEEPTIYKCVICGKAWTKKQSLRAHMKVHKGKGYRTTHIVVASEKWDQFKKFCGDHNMTTCHMIDALLTLAITGRTDGIIDVRGPNPVIFNLSQVFLGKPRSSLKIDVTRDLIRGPSCPRCGSRQVSTIDPEGLEYGEGRCIRCGAQWHATYSRPGRNVFG